MGATNSGGRVRTWSGGRASSSVSTPPARAQARASPPTTATASLSPLVTRVRAWLMTSCWETPISQSTVRAPRRPDPPGDRARRVGRATTTLGGPRCGRDRPAGRVRRRRRRPPARPAVMSSLDRRAVVRRPEADEHGAARVAQVRGVRVRPRRPMLRSGDGDGRCGQVGRRALRIRQGQLRGARASDATCSGSAPARP